MMTIAKSRSFGLSSSTRWCLSLLRRHRRNVTRISDCIKLTDITFRSTIADLTQLLPVSANYIRYRHGRVINTLWDYNVNGSIHLPVHRGFGKLSVKEAQKGMQAFILNPVSLHVL